MNTNFSSQKFESHFKFYTSDWSNHYDFLWQAHATGNYAPQSYGLHHLEYLQFDNPSSNPSSYNYPPKQSSLEETLKEFMQKTGQSTCLMSQELSLENTLEAFEQTASQCIQELQQSREELKHANTQATIGWKKGLTRVRMNILLNINLTQ